MQPIPLQKKAAESKPDGSASDHFTGIIKQGASGFWVSFSFLQGTVLVQYLGKSAGSL
jgi:hypothetical protein